MGAHCLPILAAKYDLVTVLARRRIPDADPRINQLVVDFDKIAELAPNPVDDVYCALGSTIAKAGSEEAFRKIDHGYPLAAARWGHANGARRYVLVSSVGAAPDSPSFYLRVKGDLEAQLGTIGFESLHIFQPSVLLGERSENRPLERLGQTAVRWLQFALAGQFEKYRGMPAATLASAMVASALTGKPGRHVYHWREILQLAKEIK